LYCMVLPPLLLACSDVFYVLWLTRCATPPYPYFATSGRGTLAP
jgi:hypothetical protein